MARDALTPRLSSFDSQVLAALDTGRGQRASHVAGRVAGDRRWLCAVCGRVTVCQEHHKRLWNTDARISCLSCLERGGWRPDKAATMRPIRHVTDEQAREVREVLRGLERVGKAVQAGGWWRRA
jgi:hypothetical protein